MASFVQNPGHGLLAPVFEEKVIHQPPDGSFLRVGHELPVLPAVAEGSRTAQRLTELRPDRDGGRHPLGDLLPLPLGHRGDHGVEEPAGRSGGIDGLLKRNQIRFMLLEKVGELQQLPGIPGETGELRKDEALDLVGLDVGHHAFRLGKAHHGLSGDGLQVVDGDDFPALRLRVHPSALLVVLRTFALRLIFGRDPNPDADPLRRLRTLFRFGPRGLYGPAHVPIISLSCGGCSSRSLRKWPGLGSFPRFPSLTCRRPSPCSRPRGSPCSREPGRGSPGRRRVPPE
jgi:hypothetical protein